MMNLNFSGRVRNMSLASSHALYPLYEAIVNSIHAIQAIPSDGEGQINIYLQRDDPQALPDMVRDNVELLPVCGFIIKDNGIGFTDRNFEAFNTSDTDIKADIGGKGIGRLTWLKAFDRVEVESVYRQDGMYRRRAFSFTIENEGVGDVLEGDSDSQKLCTEVRLIGFKTEFKASCPKTLSAITNHIAEHYLEYLVLDFCPQIRIYDADDRFSSISEGSIILQKKESQFNVSGHAFNVTNLRLDSSQHPQHMVHYCGDKRVVVSEKLSNHITDLKGKIRGDGQEAFTYAAYVSSPYLDSKVNAERTGFDIPARSIQEANEEVFWDDIVSGTVQGARDYLKPFVDPICEAKKEVVERYVTEEAPRFRYVLESRPQVLDNIPPEPTEAKMEEELNKALYALKVELRQKAKEMLDKEPPTIENFPKYKEEFADFLANVNEFGKSELAEYVVHRRLVLNLVEKALAAEETGGYQDEDIIHSLIFPMRRTSDNLSNWDSQNLWLIDERLAYHRFLASEKSFKSMELVGTDSLKRPDIIVINRAFAFSEDTQPLHSVVIVEFKKPMRKNYAESDNPVDQIYGYIERIRAGKETGSNGRPLLVSDSTRFDCYIVADITPSLETFLNRRNLKKTADGLGYFIHHDGYNAYLEVIPFSKLIENARKRNQILFEKLNLPK